MVVLNIVSGGSVRLSGSGLGCPDWPTCSKRSITPALSLHPMIEFGNRMVVVLLVIVAGAALLAVLARRPYRGDLAWLASGLVAGIFAEAGVGAAVVYSHLNPYVVAGHFFLGIVLLANATVLALRSSHAPGRGVPKVARRELRLAAMTLAVLACAMAAGSAATGAGPHAGGPGAKRIPVPFEDLVRTHSIVVIVAGAMLLVLLAALYRADAPVDVQDRGRILLVVMAAQGVLGYTQYFLHVPAVLVGFHILGAALVTVIAIWFVASMLYHQPADTEGSRPGAPEEYVASARHLDRVGA
jgi:cytochrome c oxidase assembly protein subunit 15